LTFLIDVVLQVKTANITTAHELGTIGAGNAIDGTEDVYIINKTSTASPIDKGFFAVGTS
jgi:hypothetical protein